MTELIKLTLSTPSTIHYFTGMYRLASLLLILTVSCSPQLDIEKMVTIQYPSGSALVILHNEIYLVGDDVNYIQVLDTLFASLDTIALEGLQGTRIQKDRKQDLEAGSLLKIRGLPVLFFAGSGSLDSLRNQGWLVYPFKKEKMGIRLDSFYHRLQQSGIKELNIEGITATPGGFILANRGNLSNPRNHLVFTAGNFWQRQGTSDIRLVKVGAAVDSRVFQGVSGLDYSKKSDDLVMTVSTEATASAYEDGAIGKSYLWIIHNISGKKRMAALNPNRIIDLEEMDERFAGHKMESVSILSETKKEMVLILAADNDDGRTTLFKVRLRK